MSGIMLTGQGLTRTRRDGTVVTGNRQARRPNNLEARRTLAGVDEVAPSTADVQADPFSVSLSFNGAVFAIELFGELDMAGVPELEQAIARAEETDAVTILVDLSSLQFIDSSGVRVLLAESKRSTSGTNRLHFLRGTGQVAKTLELCGLAERLPFLD